MSLRRLEVSHFRCITDAKLEFSSSRNILIGSNGAGKTSILESIYLLGSGHSFRSTVLDVLVQARHPELLVVGDFRGVNEVPTTIGVRVSATKREFRINGHTPHGLGELVRFFPVQAIDPEIHRLLEDGPSRRRRYVDWGVFHVEHSFHDAWRRFNRALKQRNAALKQKSKDGVGAWDNDIIVQGTVITEQRLRYLDSLRYFVADVGRRLLNLEVDFEYLQGWRRNTDLSVALAESKLRDLQRCTTGVGPHRADLILKVDGHLAKDRISRGQQKLLACTLMLAQQFHRAAAAAPPACLLLDDPAAELDADSVSRLLEIVSELPVQLIITALSSSGLNLFKGAKMFHVEHGSIKAVA